MFFKKKSFLFNWFKKKKKDTNKKKKKTNWSQFTKIISKKIKNFFLNKKIDDNFLKRLEEKLILSDFGLSFSKKIINKINYKIRKQGITKNKQIYSIFKKILKKILLKNIFYKKKKKSKPYIILVVGVNGVGKTSSIGKLAKKYIISGKSVLLAAGDTFRPGAINQIKQWGYYNSIPVISQNIGSDPASVIYDSVYSAKSKKIDIVIADTSGRLQNKLHLMHELKKIVSVIKKIDNNAPHEILLTLDAHNGQNSIEQTKIFNKILNINGIILTKLDGTSKGGIIFSILHKFSIPIRYVSVGENIDDLHIFNCKEYLNNFFFKK